MHDPYAKKMQSLTETMLSGPGQLAPEVRKAAASGRGVPEVLASYVGKVARHAYKVTDGDVQALREAGYTEDQIFELTACTALGSALLRLEQGLKPLQGGD